MEVNITIKVSKMFCVILGLMMSIMLSWMTFIVLYGDFPLQPILTYIVILVPALLLIYAMYFTKKGKELDNEFYTIVDYHHR